MSLLWRYDSGCGRRQPLEFLFRTLVPQDQTQALLHHVFQKTSCQIALDKDNIYGQRKSYLYLDFRSTCFQLSIFYYLPCMKSCK
uniref:Uncharacterized protein n=1 Tax=Medicago truncatula TaxID=3880 RepID=I3SJ90_MEDTR|nr:unknown [Medicago truncatula]